MQVEAKVVSKQIKINSSIKVPHMLYEQLKWVKQSPPSHPTLRLEASVSDTGYHQFRAHPPPETRKRTAKIRLLADTRHAVWDPTSSTR